MSDDLHERDEKHDTNKGAHNPSSGEPQKSRLRIEVTILQQNRQLPVTESFAVDKRGGDDDASDDGGVEQRQENNAQE
jgi:hypothetical protein